MQTLFWSRRGEVACSAHAPAQDSSRWPSEGWRTITTNDAGRRRYECQHCAGRPHQRKRVADLAPLAGSPVILNVDDRAAALYLRDRILRASGFTVANAETGQQALDLARRLKPSLILLDVFLPDVDGRDLCQRLKVDPELGDVPVVLISSQLTGYASQLEGVTWANADGFIADPVQPEALVSTLRHVLQTH